MNSYKKSNRSNKLPNPTPGEIKNLRIKKGLSQAKVGSFLNVTRAAISLYEKGRTPMPVEKWSLLQEVMKDLPVPPVKKPKYYKIVIPRPSGKYLKDFREKKGLTIQEVALLLNLTPASIYGYENGNSRIPFTRWKEFQDKLSLLPDK